MRSIAIVGVAVVATATTPSLAKEREESNDISIHVEAVFGEPERVTDSIQVVGFAGSIYIPGVGGTNFDTGTIPYINSVPSVALFDFDVDNIPLEGGIACRFTNASSGALPEGDCRAAGDIVGRGTFTTVTFEPRPGGRWIFDIELRSPHCRRCTRE